MPDVGGDSVPPGRETPDNAFNWSNITFPSSGRNKRELGHPCVEITVSFSVYVNVYVVLIYEV